jgi:hypothetical protein
MSTTDRARERQRISRRTLEDPSRERVASVASRTHPAIALKRTASAPAAAVSSADVLALQRSVGNQATQRLLAERRGRLGTALPDPTRQQLGRALDADLGAVRLHTDARASAAARELDARAFTVGQDIYWGDGEFSPGTPSGDRLLAHEVAHTVQQGHADATQDEPLAVVAQDDRSEVEAERFAESWGRGGATARPARIAPSISRRVLQRAPTTTTADAPTDTAVELIVSSDLTGSDKDSHCSTRDDARFALVLVRIHMLDLADQLDDVGQDALTKMAATTQAEIDKLSGPTPLAAGDVGYLDGYLKIAHAGELQLVNLSIERLLALLPSMVPDEASIKEMQNLEDALDEQAHKAFQATSRDQLGKVIGFQKKISGWNKAVGEYAGKVKSGSDKMKGLAGADSIGKTAGRIKDGSKALKEQLDQAKEVLDIASDVATLAGVDNVSNGTQMMEGIKQFRAAWDLCDKVVGKFGKAVPLFGTMWEKYYKPLVEACLKALDKIAVLDEFAQREFIIGDWATNNGEPRNAAGVPIIPRGLELTGGQAVLDYVYPIHFGRGTPSMTDTVKEYFLKNQSILNAAHIGDTDLTSDWKLFSPSTWSLKGRETNLEKWIPDNIDSVWGMLYGGLARYIPA